MKAAQFIRRYGRRRQAIALVLVITVVALMSILMVAIFSVTRMEYKSTQAYVYGKSAKQLGDIAVAIVQGQIENAVSPSEQNSKVTNSMLTHATQPGMVRTYDASGAFKSAYKLYSSSTMKVTGNESSLYSDQHVPPSNWSTFPARYVDLNEPVVRPGLAAGTYAVFFPVLDPRAAWNYGGGGQNAGAVVGSTQVEGFSYTKVAPTVGNGGGQDYSNSGSSNGNNQVITPTDTTNPDNLRLPMPVEWIYVLEDGTMGVLDSANNFITSGANSASASNPIVGRIAFWTDDESCKININTASEPTFVNSPFFYHERDAKWAHFPPVTGEYQRYPGHPATVALSAVLAPNYTFDPLLPTLDSFTSATSLVQTKEKFYTITPKISGGGSYGGTRPFAQDDFSGQNGEGSSAVAINLTTSSKARLYATVDELLFKDGFDSSVGRQQQLDGDTLPNGNYLINHDIIERSRFFLTAQSRSPEFNIHGLPRVCIWPVSDENALGPRWRTSFDNMIAFCASMQKNAGNGATGYKYSYIFRRADSRNGTNDVYISRNGKLLSYLVDQMSDLSWPNTAFNPNSSYPNFRQKYGNDNVYQMAVQFFDYIRCTNLYDGITARNNNAMAASGTSVQNKYIFRDQSVGDCYTFTSQRISPPPNSVDVSGDTASSNQQSTAGQGGVLPGHGQVSPAVWEKNGVSYKGFGRMFTISEIGFQFICTADGTPTNHLGAMLNNVYDRADATYGTGGNTALRYGVNPGSDAATVLNMATAYQGLLVSNQPNSDPAVWYSNFPPLIPPQNATPEDVDAFYQAAAQTYGCPVGRGGDPDKIPARHPGFWPQFWNMTLPSGIWLAPQQKRIQVMLLLETFCPSLGYTGFYPEYTIVLDGTTIANMKMLGADGQMYSLFNTVGDIPIKSYTNIYANGHSADILGGHASPTSISGGRHTRQISQGGGTVYMPKDVNYDTNNTSGHNAMQNYAFCSDFVTVNSPVGGSLTVQFPSGDIKIRIYDTHNWENANPVQVMSVNFSNLASSVPIPNLAQSLPYTESPDSFGRITYTRTRQGPHYWTANYEGCIGRMYGVPNPDYGSDPDASFWQVTPRTFPDPNSSDSQALRDAQGLRGRLDTTALISLDQRTGLNPLGLSVIAPNVNGSYTDVVRTIVPAMGDYRTLAARYSVPSSWWMPHPMNNTSLAQVHSFTNSMANLEPGCKLAQSGGDDTSLAANYNGYYQTGLQLVGGARFDITSNGNTYYGLHPRQADLPPGEDYANSANAFGDFDTGISNAREGPYINKPDEGNFYAGNETINSQTKFYRSAYFFDTWQNADDWRSGIYMTPNRMISSPVMFGSLPTGVWLSTSNLPSAYNSSAGDFSPWQTLLFRPHAQITSQTPNSQISHPGLQDPSDHYLLDLFFMPVVEPYAISEPLSIAGRVNMNYQIMPFINIRRATGMHAVMKGEYMTAIPNNHIVAAKEYYPVNGNVAVWDQRFWNDSGDKRYWHRPIDVATTLRQFDMKFAHQSGGQNSYQGLFRSASQICEMHLVPQSKGDGSGTWDPIGASSVTNQNQLNDVMNDFWSKNRATGDNVRERPYSNLYARLTTRSNTFRVHVRTQLLKKARSTPATTFVPGSDQVIGEYRGSVLLERFIDINDPTITIPDYADDGISGQFTLDSFYRFHALETKRFNP